MKSAILTAAILGMLALGGCGGGDDPAPTPAPAPPTGGTPPAPPPTGPATTEFNVVAAQLALQTDAASERTLPIDLDTYTFAFSDADSTVLNGVLPR